MKHLNKILFFILILFINLLQAQDWIKNFSGIPLETGLVWDWVTKTNGLPGNKGAVDSMKLAGIDIVHILSVSPGRMDTTIKWLNTGFRVLPIKSFDNSGNVYNWIQHYTDAKYSVWEAEGSALGNDDVGLIQMDGIKTEIVQFDSSTLISRRGNIQNSVDQFTEGPYYDQDVYYYAAQDNKIAPVTYNANFYLMLENNTPASPYNPEDTICILQVTYSNNLTPTVLDTTAIIKKRIVKRNDFDNLGIIDTVSISYRLDNTISLAKRFLKKANLKPGPRDSRGYIQFKVIWCGKSNKQGKPKYLLSFDKVILSDERGRELKDSSSKAFRRIELQDQKLISYKNDIPGWIGIDEPVSIDVFEPIRIVKEVLGKKTANSRPLIIPFMGSWSGYWDVANNKFGAMGKSRWKVFRLRVGSINIIQNFYLYEYPYRSNKAPCNCISYRDKNIRVLAEMNYKQAYQLDPNFGASIQCGAIENTQAYQRNVRRHEVLYNANLALMYGAKFIQLWNYFAQTKTSVNSGYTNHGIVDWNPSIKNTIYTDKYFMLRDTLNPRLEGWFGQTIKKLIPEFERNSLGITLSKQNKNVEFIKNINLLSTPSDSIPIFDLGFFSNPSSPDPTGMEDRYFMLLKRYYPQSLGLESFNLSFSHMLNFNNWQITDYIDSLTYTIYPNQKGEYVSNVFKLLKGDAVFYRLAPVVKYGGKLVYNESVTNGTTLYSQMTIEKGASLTVNGVYNASANIIVKPGGRIIYKNNSKIVFSNGARLINE